MHAAPQYGSFRSGECRKAKADASVVEKIGSPTGGSINQAARLPYFFAGIDIFRLHNPQAVFAASRRGTVRVSRLYAPPSGRWRVPNRRRLPNSQNIPDPRLISGFNTGLPKRRPVDQQAGAFTQMIVHKQTNADHPAGRRCGRYGRRKRIRKRYAGHFQ